ncbi:hypothetical protein FPG101_08810 [Flavobacterium psychrophilum FPG101]|nr:hypothetical protein FPG101_08810 [Flavobacterium psychrophilum FPG101]KUM19756.1 hypothetical protein AS885_08490 [Flavobacterium psychrophilum]ROO16302.1 hypothetical protein FPG104_10710 [Flavobacterium psychrophilum 10]OJH11670.1 hypothetical protein FPG103_08120 [Flavobacterium psychrophilum]OJH11711.1 hypothetical protein FPG87_08550 [Flavobacterium psychrophilum]
MMILLEVLSVKAKLLKLLLARATKYFGELKKDSMITWILLFVYIKSWFCCGLLVWVRSVCG